MGNPNKFSSSDDGGYVSLAQQLVEERQRTHGDAWIITGRVLAVLIGHLHLYNIKAEEIGKYWWPICNVIACAIRACFTPKHLDHWMDIQGYAQLVINDIRKEHEDEDQSVTSAHTGKPAVRYPGPTDPG